MDEVLAILIAVGAMVVGILAIGWAYGDFRPRPGARSRGSQGGYMATALSLVLGLVLFAVGVWGSLTGGHDHELIAFGINFTHNLVHILSGVVALLAAMSGEYYAKLYCLIFGAVYGLVAVGGIMNIAPLVQLLNLNLADNVLHLAIAAACLLVGVKSKAA